MLNKNKSWSSLLGAFAGQIYIGKGVDYSGVGASPDTAGTYADFVANAAEGEIGIFNEDVVGKPVISGALSGSPLAATAVGKGINLFVALKRNGFIEKSNVFNLTSDTAERVPYAAAVAQISKATIAGTPVVGTSYDLVIIETTAGIQPFPQWRYSYVAKAADSVTTIAAALVALINDQTNVTNKTSDTIVTASASAGVITVTANTPGTSFRFGSSLGMVYDLGIVFAYTGGGTAAPFFGSGAGQQIVDLEQYADVDKGVTTNYPNQSFPSLPADYGKPVVFADATKTYDIIMIKGITAERSPTPFEQHTKAKLIMIVVPATGTSPIVSVRGILGV